MTARLSVSRLGPKRRAAAAAALALVVTAGLAASPAQAPQRQATARYSAFAVDMTGNMGAASASIDILITHWATEAESARVMNTLLEQGPAKLLAMLRDLPRAGSVSTPGSIGFDIRYARRTVGSSGAEQIFLLTDRPIGMGEASAQSRSLDYPFTIVDLKLNSGGRGDGTITAAAKIGVDRVTKLIVLENISDQPIRLQQVRREGR
jgi:hypothetical protein